MGLVDIVIVGLCLNSTIENGTCPNDQYTEPTLGKRFIFKQTSLKGQHFRITTLQNKPLSYTEYENGTLVGKGVAFQFINFLQKKYDFTYSVVLPEEDVLGSKTDGVFGMLYKNKADIAAAFLPVIPTYWSFGPKYSIHLDVGEWVVLMRRPKESATGSGLLSPFTFHVWLLILVSLVAVGPVMYALIALQAKLCKDEYNKVYPLDSYIWFVYGALLKQGTNLNPTTDSSRLLFSTWWIFITILTAFYTANLTAFLTLSRFTLPIDKPRDIGAKHYQWVARRGNAIEEASRVDGSSQLTEILEGSVGRFLDSNDSVILENSVKKRNLMFIREKPIVDHLMYEDYLEKTKQGIEEAKRCTYVITNWPVLTFARAFAYSADFEHHELFDSRLRYLVEGGIVKFMLREGLPDTKICPLDLGSKDRQLTNSDLFMTYVIVAVGFIISGIIFVTELAFKLYHHHKKPKSITVKTDMKTIAKSKHTFETAIGDGFYKYKAYNNYNMAENNNLPPPPPYHALFRPPFAFSPNGKKKTINGRDYWVLNSVEGETRLVPIRSTSALLFQYTN